MMGLDLLILKPALGDEPVVSYPSFSSIQKPCLAGYSRHDDWCKKTNNDSKQPFEKEDVTPMVDAHVLSSPFRDAGKPDYSLAII